MKFQSLSIGWSFVDDLDGLAMPSKAQMAIMFLKVETSVKSKLNESFSAPNQRRCRKDPVLELEDECIAKEEGEDESTQFLHTQKNQLIDLQDHLAGYCNVLQVYSFKRAK